MSSPDSEKDLAPSVPTPSEPAVPNVIKEGAKTAGDQAREVLYAAKIIEDVENYLLAPHPREAYLETVVAYLRNPTGTPPARQFGMQDIGELLKNEKSEALLQRFQTLLENMKPIPGYLRGAIAYLRKPTHSIADINKHAINIGKVWILEPRDPAVVAIHHHFRLLQYQFHRAAFEAAVRPDRPQDIMKFFTSYKPLSQLRAQFTRDGHPQKAEEIAQMLNHELRQKADVQVPDKATEAQDTAQLITDAESFLTSGTLTNPDDITMFQRILGFLRSPTDNFADIKKRGEDIGGVLMSFMEETPPVLDAINLYFMGLLFAHHFKELKAAVAENPQNIQRVMKVMPLVVETAKYSDASVQQELDAYLQAHEIRKKA